MNEKQMEKWRATRAKGKRHFVLYRGVLGWGLWMFVVMTTWNHLRAANYSWQSLEPSWPNIVINLIIWLLAGTVWASITWTLSEQMFWRHAAPTNARV